MNDFSKYMNKPETPTGDAYTRIENGQIWIHCPFCGKKQFPVDKNTKIRNLKWKCKASTCKKESEINIGV